MSYDEIINKLREREAFTFARFGDGEINAILGHESGPGHVNCDGHRYFQDMGERLRVILTSRPQRYAIGLQPLVLTTRDPFPEFWEMLEGLEYCDGDILHKASIKGYFQTFMEEISNRTIVFVGNGHFSEMFPNIIEVPITDCWTEFEIISQMLLMEIRDKLQTLPDGDHPVILYSASMMSEVLIDDMFTEFGNQITQIDTGSVFDPYIGRKTRSYHHRLDIRK